MTKSSRRCRRRTAPRVAGLSSRAECPRAAHASPIQLSNSPSFRDARVSERTRNPYAAGDACGSAGGIAKTYVKQPVIPGRPAGPNPESRYSFRIRVWIPGSLATLAPRNDEEARVVARVLWSAPGRPSLRLAIPVSHRGERSAGRRWGLRGPRWAVCETRPVGRLASVPFLRCEAEERAFRRSTCGVLAMCGPRFRERGPATPVSQLLAAGRNACERSPAIARESGVRCSEPAAPHQSMAGFPRSSTRWGPAASPALSPPLLRLHGVP